MRFVVGKGGVGRTTVAALLAERAHRDGKRTLFISLGQPPEALEAARPLLPKGVAAMAIEGEAALAEYLSSIIGSSWLRRRIFRNELYQHFVAVAPGLRELMALGQVAAEERSGRWEQIIVDAPPTGHALEYLRMPASVIGAFGRGLVTWEARRMLSELRDVAHCSIHPVALLEELPLHELEVIREGVRQLGLSLGTIFINRVRESPYSVERLFVEAPLSVEAAAALQCGRLEASWAALHREHLQQLRLTGTDLIELPQLHSRSFGRAEIETLAERVPC